MVAQLGAVVAQWEQWWLSLGAVVAQWEQWWLSWGAVVAQLGSSGGSVVATPDCKLQSWVQIQQ